MPIGLGYAAAVCALTEAVVLGKDVLPFGKEAISALANGVAGNELQSAFRELYGKVAKTLRRANPAVNHHLQKALSQAFALAALHIVSRYGEWNGADPGPAEKLLPGRLVRAWRAAGNFLSPPDPLRGPDEGEAREITALLFDKLIALANDPPLTDQPVGAIAEVYENLEKLLSRTDRPREALRLNLTKEAPQTVSVLAGPRGMQRNVHVSNNSSNAAAEMAWQRTTDWFAKHLAA